MNLLQHTDYSFLFIIFFPSGPRRKVDYAGGGDGGRNGSVWSAAQLQANEAPARVSIDWNTIRENKDKYEELKWKGELLFYMSSPQLANIRKVIWFSLI